MTRFNRSQGGENVVKITDNQEHDKPSATRGEEFLLTEKKTKDERNRGMDIKIDLVSSEDRGEDVGTNV